MTARCDFSDLPVDSCAHCTGRVGDEAATASDAAIVATWEARFPGRCHWCDGGITPGERMGRDEHDSYVCARCLP